ncbi:hypothetical protein [Paenibacillus sp. YPG26]|uniref:hypothetical protein n=1 Tax=Paenibacillus sp. YPG26 TaxID=2878915 RepID=UPI00203CC356|nr:hypothetical protein [Paenibacillus sp. YPG26]USB34806.1 hypothetical protein LDO05_08680 [Paenibacillus sp. YPG26]
MKLRLVPLITSAVISATLLFGGWFAYSQFGVEAPLKKLVTNYEGVKNAQFDINQKQVDLKLDLEPKTDLRGLVKQLTVDGKSIIGTRKLRLTVVDHSNKVLDQWWSRALFPVAEAMDNKKYTEIPVTLEKLKEGTPGLSVNTVMDNQNIYVSLSDGKASKFIILPRVPGEMGVWNNV